jgi:ABC-type branched-subunit amino acid transport system ATPase component/ABC-type branched-subunit amino acid transport system permease subunit
MMGTPGQVLFDGVVTGLVYGLLAMGIVLVHRSTRVINFAVAGLGLPGVVLFAMLVVRYHVPYWPALLLALLAGTAFATVMELIVVRRLFRAPRVILLVATIGITQVATAVALSLPRGDDVDRTFPQGFTVARSIGSITVAGADQLVLVAVPIVAAALGWLLTRTAFGRRVEASADNPDLARLSGVSPKTSSTIVWAIAGLVATISMILIAGQVGSVSRVSTLGPATLSRALIVAVIAGLASFPRAVVAGVVVGVVQAAVSYHSLADPGRIDSLLLLTVLVVVIWETRRGGPEERAVFSFAARARPIPPEIADRWWVRHHGRILFVVAVALGAAVPLVVSTPSRIVLYGTVLTMALVALSVSIVTGWSGQLSLGQMAFAGIGALGAATLVRGGTLTTPSIGGWRIVASNDPLTLPFAALVMAVICGLVAAIIGVGALRVRGLLLGVSTFVFAYACQQYLFRLHIFTGGMTPPIRLPRGRFGPWDLTTQRTYYWVVLAAVALVVSIVARIRRRGPGRKMVAVRDNPDTAAAYTVGRTVTRLSGYALSGAIAGFAGALLGGISQNINTNQLFVVADSLEVVAIAVIGGLGSISGPILGALWVEGLPAFFPGNDLVPLFTSGIGLLVLLLYFPGGLVQIGYGLRDAVFSWAARRATTRATARAASEAEVTAPTGAKVRTLPARTRRPADHPDGKDGDGNATPALVATDVRVRFGGIEAVAGVDLTVARGEVVGLIGTNGAGKSTLLNAIGGFVPATGRIEVDGTDVSSLAAHRRARTGLGRTFQAATLFPELTVRETLLVAMEARRRSSIWATALALPQAGRAERRNVAEADELIDFLGLGRYADATIGTLSTGTRRIVELAGLLALDARVLCLDEPTAGVAQRETEAFGPLILAIRRELDASVLVIEHDMPLIMSMSDRVYCLDAGRVIAEGPPAGVRHDPAVVASYLGTDARAIERSDAG